MLQMDDIIYTLLLIFVLGLSLVIVHGLSVNDRFTSTGAIHCGVNNPCALGLKCINGFCAKTERLRAYENDADNQAESSPGSPAPFLAPK